MSAGPLRCRCMGASHGPDCPLLNDVSEPLSFVGAFERLFAETRHAKKASLPSNDERWHARPNFTGRAQRSHASECQLGGGPRTEDDMT